MGSLKPHQMDLLRVLVLRGSPVAAESLDRRNLRPLKAQELVTEANGIVRVTEAGYACVRRTPTDEPDRTATRNGRLSEQQEEVLRYLLRQTGPVPEEHLDGRVLRALRVQRLVSESAGWVSATEEARSRLARHVDRERVSRRRRGDSAASARADAIHRAVEELDAALPRDAEIMIGDMPAYADDVVSALRRFARKFGTRSTPRP